MGLLTMRVSQPSQAALLASITCCILAITPLVASAKRNAYVTASTSGNISAFDVDLSTGTLTTVSGSPFAAGGAGPSPFGVAITPAGDRVLVANSGNDTAGMFDINQATGSLTAVAGSPFATGGTGPAYVAITPDGKRALVSNSSPSNDISVFDINATTGALTQVSGSPFATGDSPNGVAVTPDGRFVIVAYDSANSLRVFEMNQSTGALTTVGALATVAPGDPEMVAITPDGRRVLVADENGFVSVFDFNTSSGALTQVSGSPFAAGTDPRGIAVTPGGLRALSADTVAGVIVGDLNATSGVLTQVSGSPFTAGTSAIALALTPDGKRVLVSNRSSNNLSVFDLNGTSGALTQVSGSPYTVGTGPDFQSVAITPDQPPTAGFTAKAGIATRSQSAKASTATTFNAGSSSDPDGQIARYDWDFGDGTTLGDGGATPSHTYKKAGTYTVSVTTTDSEGCSTDLIFTGQTAYCNGSSAARATQQVAVPKRPRVKIRTSRAKLLPNGVVRLRLKCMGTLTCKGKLSVRTARKSGRSFVKLVRRKSFRVPGGKTRVVRVKPSRRGKALVRRAGRKGLRVRVSASVRSVAGTTTTRRKLTVKMAR